jgi:GAF domain-containing protein
MIPRDPSPLHSLLAVIEASGSPVALEHELERAQAAGLLSDTDAAAARRVHQSLDRGRRRESLLRVLLESSTDLAAITDFEDVLHAIVRRTRTLLGSDMAYISLNDYERRETYIHTTDGVATDSYRNIRMELGTGVLGKIADGTSPSQSLDYTGDPDFVHVPEIDRIVEGEGVHSIMGAPLLRNGALLGALLVAERYQRQFTAEEMWLVESMSSLASVALSNARLIGEMKATLSERDLLQAEREREHLSLAADQSLERAMMECVVGDDPYGSFLALLSARAGAEAWILDGAGSPLHGPDSPKPHRRDLAEAMSRSAHTAEAHTFSAASNHGGVAERYSLMTATAGSRTLGAVLLKGDVDDSAWRNLTRSGLILSVMLLIDETRFESDVRAQSELIGRLIRHGVEHEASLAPRAARFGVNLGRPVTVHVLDAGGQEQRALNLLRALTDAAQGVMAIENGTVVLIHPTNIAEEALAVLTAQNLPVTLGTDTVSAFSGSLQESYRSAERSLRALLALGMAGSIGSRHSLGMLGLLMHTASQEAVDAVITDAIGPLLAYDATKQAQLVDTVWAFFAAGRLHSAAAAALHVHPNTLRQRLDRISLILGKNWTDPSPSSQLFLALQLHRLRSRNV